MRCFEEKPDAVLKLIDPVLKQAGGCHISPFVAERMRRAD
jgi:hypothetical protein